MEIEKCLYKIHERTLGVSCCQRFMKACFFSLFMLNLFAIAIFVFGNIKYKDHNNILEPIYDSLKKQNNGTDLPNETLYHIYVADYEKNLSNTSQIIVNSHYLHLLFSGNHQVLNLDRDIKNKYNFTEIHIYIYPSKFYSNDFEKIFVKEFFTYESLLINQIIFTFDKIDKYIKNANSLELWSFYQSDLDSIQFSKEPVKAFFLRLLGVIKIIFGLFLVSNTTAIYIMITVISAPILLLSLFECFIRFGNQNENTRLGFFKAFPWIGLYMYALQSNNKKQIGYVLMAFFFMIIIFYTFYISCLLLWNALLFNMSFKRGSDQNFYGYIIFLEFASLLFIRTRSSLRYYPPIIFFLLFMYIFYLNFNAYALFGPAYLVLILSTLTILTSFLAFLEIPALTWNPSYHYTPSINKPRTLYFPMFNLSWFYDLPQFWTFFYPLHDRSTFTLAEMSLVDRNYILLNQTLDNAVNNPEGLIANQNIEMGHENIGNNNFGGHNESNVIPEGENQNYPPQDNL